MQLSPDLPEGLMPCTACHELFSPLKWLAGIPASLPAKDFERLLPDLELVEMQTTNVEHWISKVENSAPYSVAKPHRTNN